MSGWEDGFPYTQEGGIANTPTEFDKALHDIWDELDLNTSAENFKSAIKQAVDKYVIGGDEPIPKSVMDWSGNDARKNVSNETKAILRQSLWGKN